MLSLEAELLTGADKADFQKVAQLSGIMATFWGICCFTLVPEVIADFRGLPPTSGYFRRLPVTSADFRRLPVWARVTRRPPSGRQAKPLKTIVFTAYKLHGAPQRRP